MSTMSMARSSLWAIDTRVIVYAAIGAALYGVLASASVVIPGTTAVSVRPGFALVPFFGYAFGPIVGFFTGLVGNMIGDQISGWGALTSPHWSLANGLVGLIAGVMPMYLKRWVDQPGFTGRAIAAALGGSIAVVIGFLAVFLGIVISAMDFSTILTTEYIPVVVVDIIATVIIVPALLYLWAPAAERTGR